MYRGDSRLLWPNIINSPTKTFGKVERSLIYFFYLAFSDYYGSSIMACVASYSPVLVNCDTRMSPSVLLSFALSLFLSSKRTKQSKWQRQHYGYLTRFGDLLYYMGIVEPWWRRGALINCHSRKGLLVTRQKLFLTHFI